MPAPDPPESWPERDHGGLLAEHVTLGTGAYRVPAGDLRPTVSVELLTRNFDNPEEKRAIKVYLDLTMLRRLIDDLPAYIERAEQNVRARQSTDNGGGHVTPS